MPAATSLSGPPEEGPSCPLRRSHPTHRPGLLVRASSHPDAPEPEYAPQSPGGGQAPASNHAKVLLVASTRDLDGFLADGKDFAEVHAFYEGGGEGAPADVYVYLRWS